MSSVNSKIAQAFFPLLTVTLLSVGCEESTAPSSGEIPMSQPTAQPPTGPVNTPGGSAQTPVADTGEARKVDRPARGGDTAGSSQRPSLATVTTAAPTAVAKAGWITPRGVTCSGASLARQLTVNNIFVGRSTGSSYYLDQRIVMKAWFYRYNANTRVWDRWPYPAVTSLDLPYGNSTLPYYVSGDLPIAWYKPSTAGYYAVVVQLFWYAKYPQGFVQTTSATVNFNSASDYIVDSQVGSTAGPYYCYIN
jgi:hypothetical protein